MALLLALGGIACLPADDITLVADGASAFSIYRAPDAPPSVVFAAGEIQRIVKASTGVELSIVHEPAQPMICLGANAAATQAGLSAEGLADDGFIIQTTAGSIYIVGKDYPGDKAPWSGWTSRGTMFGACEFLENVVGVRWLMPGEFGEDIPAHATITVPHLSVRQEPDFQFRLLSDIQEQRARQPDGYTEAQLWLLRHKTPSVYDGRKLPHGHAWDQYVTQEQVAAHPEWLAVDEDGNRRQFPRFGLVKYCTSNPELLDAFAAGVIKWFDDHPDFRSASISPSDGGDFCHCAACEARRAQDPHGRVSTTPLVLRFYNEIARRVAVKYPDKLLAGYVYYNYMYPPTEPVEMAPSLHLVWAPLNYYGRGLQKPLYKAEHRQVCEAWAAVTPNFVLHNYSTWMRAFNGTPLPPALDILKIELPAVHAVGAVGANMVGLAAWGYGGPNNYILCEQMWDADVDVDMLFDEWLQRAYGPGAAPMREMLMLIDERFRARKQAESPDYRGVMYEVNYDVVADVYQPIFEDMERLYLEAVRKAETDAQRGRLELFGENLIQLHWSMRKVELLDDPTKSTFYRTDEQYEQFLADTENSLGIYWNNGKRHVAPVWKGEWSG